MKKINFENLPSTNTPISANNLNKMQSNIEESAVIVSPTEPTTSEKVWIQKGKNLFNKNNVTRDVMLEDDGSLTSYYNYYVSDYIPIQSGKTYTLGTTASTRNKFFKSNYTPYSTGRDVDAQYNANTFTVPDDVCFIRITIDLNECDINQVQLEQGTAATPYEAYVEPKIYLKNDNGVYEEFVNVNNLWTLDHEQGTFSLNSGYSFQDNYIHSPYLRKSGGIVEFNAIIKCDNNIPTTDTIIGTINSGFRPMEYQISCAFLGIDTDYGWTYKDIGWLLIETNGKVHLRNSTGVNYKYALINIKYFAEK